MMSMLNFRKYKFNITETKNGIHMCVDRCRSNWQLNPKVSKTISTLHKQNMVYICVCIGKITSFRDWIVVVSTSAIDGLKEGASAVRVG